MRYSVAPTAAKQMSIATRLTENGALRKASSRINGEAARLSWAMKAPSATMVQVLSVSQGPCGIIGVICIRPDCMLQFLVSVVIAIVCTFVITLVFAKTIGRKQLATL